MDIIEMQITSALQHLPYLDLDNDTASEQTHTTAGESQPTSPRTITSMSHTINDSIRRKVRPGTRDSAQSGMTVDTSKPLSVIGQLNNGSVRRGLGSILDLDQVSSADRVLAISKSDSITHRVAIIQAKVGYQWSPVRLPSSLNLPSLLSTSLPIPCQTRRESAAPTLALRQW
jgi:hypothetical protein